MVSIEPETTDSCRTLVDSGKLIAHSQTAVTTASPEAAVGK